MSTASTYTIGRPTHLSDSNSTPVSPRRNLNHSESLRETLKLRRPTQPISTMRLGRSQNQAPRTNLNGSSSATPSSLSNPIEISSDEEGESDRGYLGHITEEEMHIPLIRCNDIAEQLPEFMITTATEIMLDDEPEGDDLQATYLCRIRGDRLGIKLARHLILSKLQKNDPKDRKGKGRVLS